MESQRWRWEASVQEFIRWPQIMAVGKNMNHSQEEKPLILSVYTEAEERFWLFYAITKPT
jgi:hypothetical protein